ncbi:MAG: hypothetical protein K9J27_06005 [Bacteroidales bacterium]|nr:hypothetical protein [Bacteroidales bacterium]MCF8334877.1 hypothetical protein [Bacteroidales bacterium]
MRLRSFKYLSFFIVVTVFGFAALTSCEEDDSNDSPNDNGNGTEKTWEPYKFDPNVFFAYDFYTQENGEEQSSGTVEIQIQDPAVEVDVTIDGENYNFVSNSYDAISDNFRDAVSNTPVAIIYQPYWESAFADEVIEEGSSWSYTFDEGSISFEVTGTDTYAGIEGYVVEYDFQNDSGENVMWEICANLEMSLPLMSHWEDSEGEVYHIELTDYQE